MKMRSIGSALTIRTLRLSLVGLGLVVAGCEHPAPKYGTELQSELKTKRRQTWAIAPAVNLSGQRHVDPILQADLVYGQMQQVKGLAVIPVNRVAEVYAAMRIEQVRSEDQAAAVCEMLGCDALIVPTVTAYDPYDPPKMGASLQLLPRIPSGAKAIPIDVRRLRRTAGAEDMEVAAMPKAPETVQTVGMFDAANGSTREAVAAYAAGRFDPVGPYGEKEYFVSMDRYCGFVYHELIVGLLRSPKLKPS